MEVTNLEYTKAKLSKRFFAFLTDQFLIFLMTFIFFSLTNMVLPYINAYNEVINERYELMDRSSLFNEDHIVITELVTNDEEFKDYNEKKNYLSEHIDEFYSNTYYFSDPNEIKEEYDDRKLNYRYNNVSLFETDSEGIVKEKVGNNEGLYNFYLEEINDHALRYLYTNDIYLHSTRVIFITSILNFLIWLILMVSFFYLLFPLVIFKRGRQTIGRKIFSISLISVNALNLSKSKYLYRYLFILFIMYILDFFSFMLPLLVSIGMMFISKRNQDLVDYIFNTYVIDSKNDEVYLDYLEYLDKTNKDKKIKLEDKDFKPTNK